MKTLLERCLESPLIAEIELSELRGAMLVRAQNVADYFWMGTTKDHWSFASDFPNWAPPFDNLFVEYAIPKRALTEHGWVERDGPNEWRFGVHMFYVDIDDYLAEVKNAPDAMNVGARWILHAIPFSARDNEPPSPFTGSGYAFPIMADGRNHSAGSEWVHGIRLSDKPETPEEAEAATVILFSNCVPAWLTLSFLHCKNVEMIEHGPHLRPAGVRNRRGPKVKYYTLEIEPMKKVLRTEGQSETLGLKKALHICRGHFAHYTDDKKLFGKYTGTFWRPMHTRGSAEQGEIIKDYKINSPPIDQVG